MTLRQLAMLLFSGLLVGCVNGGDGNGSGSGGDTQGPSVSNDASAANVDTMLSDAVNEDDTPEQVDAARSTDTSHLADASGSTSDSGPSVDTTPSADAGPSPDEDVLNPPVDSPMTDPNCLDGQYQEELPDPTADISGLIAGYSPNSYMSFIDGALKKRYPVGAYLVQGGLANQQIGNCIDFFLQNKSSAQAIISQMSTIVHECGHFYDLGEGGFGDAVYMITDSLTLSCQGGDKFEYGGNTFVRSELTSDTFNADYPPCPEGTFGADCDFYANTYLTGNSGNQGFSMLFEEFVQYVNSLATGYAFSDFYSGSKSERDGILTFLWYIERYLYLARTQFPSTYEFLTKSECWRDAILTVWGRAWLFLGLTEGNPKLGINDGKILGLVETPELLAEIESLREHHGCQ